MDSLLTIETLQEEHKEVIENFTCTDESDVEEFLKEDAMMYQNTNMAKTRLFFDDNHNLIGYFSVFNDHVRIGRDKRKKEDINPPKGINHFPAIRLHYFGVDSRYRKLGYGEEILLSVLEHSYKLSLIAGCTFITVQALTSSIGFYEKYDFKIWKRETKKYTDMFFKIKNLDGLLHIDEEKEFLNNFV
ncbi:GNAT family N-acetyltransferase [Bacillus pseudomycoides]|uniref:GNAT family N-acetyltransferase n=1 Tax=Bacillus pseudomycoides TaxID=64104 RepID=UPI000BF518B8|nr:GNAT family N-acetyltransferase [Bacillus pseudomycoides]MED1539104.1 GNAT family N-acetyltransferase [Bacillus pseudomycoides]PGC41435.1 GNAT family N-acetyltransferase [Bacillus pseudomycoides]